MAKSAIGQTAAATRPREYIRAMAALPEEALGSTLGRIRMNPQEPDLKAKFEATTKLPATESSDRLISQVLRGWYTLAPAKTLSAVDLLPTERREQAHFSCKLSTLMITTMIVYNFTTLLKSSKVRF